MQTLTWHDGAISSLMLQTVVGNIQTDFLLSFSCDRHCWIFKVEPKPHCPVRIMKICKFVANRIIFANPYNDVHFEGANFDL